MLCLGSLVLSILASTPAEATPILNGSCNKAGLYAPNAHLVCTNLNGTLTWQNETSETTPSQSAKPTPSASATSTGKSKNSGANNVSYKCSTAVLTAAEDVPIDATFLKKNLSQATQLNRATTSPKNVKPPLIVPKNSQVSPPVVSPGELPPAYLWSKCGLDGLPYHRDPCRVMTWTLFPTGAPAIAMDSIQQALQKLSNATGISFKYIPTTATRPTNQIMAHKKVMTSLAFAKKVKADVELLFGTPSEYAQFQHLTASGGPIAGSTSNMLIFPKDTSSQASSDSNKSSQGYIGYSFIVIRNDYSWSENRLVSLLMHELGHAMGLGHTPNSNNIMYTAPTATEFGPVDLEGLYTFSASNLCAK